MNKLNHVKNLASNCTMLTFRVPVMLVLVALLAACASNSTVKESSAEGDKQTAGTESSVVVERAKARWVALLSKDLETAYSYYSPGFRSTTSVYDFMFQQRSRRVKWESAEYIEDNCTENACKIKFKTGFKVEKAVPGMDVYHGTDELEETWVKTDGQWWYIPPKR